MISTSPALPLSRDASSRFLPWLIGFMVWLAAMALALVMILSAAGQQWRTGLAGTLTVQIIPVAGADSAATDALARRAIKLLRATPGIASAASVPDVQVAALLEPWLGKDALSADMNLPVPRLIDVRLIAGGAIDSDALGAQLAAEIPGATLDDHGLWLERLVALARALEAIAFAVVGLIGLAAIATVVFATRTGLAIHHEVVELLHLIGAQDGYVARQFQGRAFWLGLEGGLIGTVLAAVTLVLLGYLAGRIEASLLPPLALSVQQWAVLAAIAPAAALISMLTARLTVQRAVGRMA
ncbi:MAG: cell division protein [Alphaproteobacteria bacterium]